jgi:hypothetical protein
MQKTIIVKKKSSLDFWADNRLFVCAEFCQGEFNIPESQQQVEVTISKQPFPGAKQMYISKSCRFGLTKKQVESDEYMPSYRVAREFVNQIVPFSTATKRFYLKIS